MTNKNISIGAGALMTISLFLPWANMGIVSASLFDGITAFPTAEGVILMLAAVGSLVTAFLDKPGIARLCSGVVLAACLYSIYSLSQLPGASGIFEVLGIGAYALFAGSIVGVLFSKK